MATYRTASSAYAIQSFGFGSTGDAFNVAGQATGNPVALVGPVDYGNATFQRGVVQTPEFETWDPELFFPEAEVSPDVTVTVPDPATARGRVDLPVPGLTLEPPVADAVGTGLVPVPTLSVTAQALAVGRAELPIPQVSVTAVVASALGDAPAPAVGVSETVTAVPALAAGRADAPTPEITVTAGAVALGDAPAPIAGTVTAVMAPPAIAVGIVGTGYGSDWGGGWGSLGSVEVIITEAEGAVAPAAIAAGSAPVPALTIAVDGTVATAAGTVPAVIPEISVMAGAVALADAPDDVEVTAVTVVDATVTAVVANAIGDTPIPTPAISVTAQALALATAPAPGHSATFTAVVALALGDAPAPVPGIAVTAVVADALGDAPAPTTGLVQSATVTVTASARALGDVSVPVVSITCELDGTPLALTTETLSVLTLTSETLTGVTLTTETLTQATLGTETLTPTPLDTV